MGRSSFHLDKWFLDFIGNNGETLIFYAARLSWRGLGVQYKSCIHYEPEGGVKTRTHLRNVQIPEKQDQVITWHDPEFKVSGSWESKGEPLYARIFDDADGYLDWHCFQPASIVQLKMGDRILEGKGYVEQLILTTPPWHIPMNDLRWGRFHSTDDTMVWIELRKGDKRQWLWLNGEPILQCSIEDDHIASADKDFLLKLDRSVVIESEKKIFQVVQNLLRFLPGFNQLMPTQFLMADNHKWLSKGEFQKSGGPLVQGNVIHEWVNFNGHAP